MTKGIRRIVDKQNAVSKTAALGEETERVLAKVQALAETEKKKTGFCIGNTTKKISHDYFFTPIRNTRPCVAGSIIVDRVPIAEEVVRVIDGRVDYIFVDTEKKISPSLYSDHDVGNVERAVRQQATKSKVLTYKGNDLTVEAIDCFLAQLLGSDIRGVGGKRVAIVGAGNIGFKLALRLTERGAHAVVVRRDAKKLGTIVRALNYIKPQSTIAKITGTSRIKQAVEDADIVIGLTPGTQDIDATTVASIRKPVILIDGGKGSFSKEAVREAERRGLPIYRTSVTPSFEGQVAMLLKMEEMLAKGIGRRAVGGIPIVSAGILGREGEIVVDNIAQPAEIYGIADGCGDFNRNPSAEEKRKMELLAVYLEEEELRRERGRVTVRK
jgi:hypothetical protein